MNPYGYLIKIGCYAFGALAIVGALVGLRYKLNVAEAELETQRIVADFALRTLEAMAGNEKVVAEIEAVHVAAEQGRHVKVEKKKLEVRHVPTKPVPPTCKAAVADAYAPVIAAVRGVRDLQDERDRSSTSADVGLPTGPGSTEPDGLGRAHRGRPQADWSLPAGAMARGGLPW